MSHLGLLALGVFVGTLICVAVRKTTNWSDAVKVIIALLGAALSGIVFTFIETLLGTSLGSALFMYPIGLAWSMLWLNPEGLIKRATSDNLNERIIGWLNIGGAAIATILVLLLVFSEKVRSMLPA